MISCFICSVPMPITFCLRALQERRSGRSGCHHVLSCSNSFQNHHLNPIWSHSPPYDNGVCAHSTSNLPVSHKSPKRDAGTTSPLSLSRPLGRGRRISHGRRETVSYHTDEKKYELDIERVLSGKDCRTTLMIKNIPNKYSSTMLLAAINEHNQGTYDFLYLPVDFKNKCNMGYAFIHDRSTSDKYWWKGENSELAAVGIFVRFVRRSAHSNLFSAPHASKRSKRSRGMMAHARWYTMA